MNDELPLISIAMPVRNNRKTLDLAVLSIQAQTYPNWELILIDDGSTDGTDERARQFAAADSRIRVFVDGRALGLPDRLNQAIALSRGPFLARMDGDDMAYPSRLERQMEYLRTHPTIDLVGSSALVFADDGAALGKRVCAETHEEICARPSAGFALVHPAFFGRMEFFRKYQYRAAAVRCEDQDLLLRSYTEPRFMHSPAMLKSQDQDLLVRSFNAARFANVPEILMGYREARLDWKKNLNSRRYVAISFFQNHWKDGEAPPGGPRRGRSVVQVVGGSDRDRDRPELPHPQAPCPADRRRRTAKLGEGVDRSEQPAHAVNWGFVCGGPWGPTGGTALGERACPHGRFRNHRCWRNGRRSMPRLLMITTVPATLRAFLLPFARHFAAQGWRVDAMARGVSACAECRSAFENVWDVEWTRNPLDLVSLGMSARQVRTVVAAQGYDLVHVHTPIAAFVARAALRKMRQAGTPRVIYTAHGFHFHSGGSPLRNALFSALERRAGRWTDELVVINREDALAALRLQIVPPEHLHYMTGIGVDTDRYHPDRVAEAEVSAVRAELGLTAGTTLFLVLGEFIARKRHGDVIEALARLTDQQCAPGPGRRRAAARNRSRAGRPPRACRPCPLPRLSPRRAGARAGLRRGGARLRHRRACPAACSRPSASRPRSSAPTSAEPASFSKTAAGWLVPVGDVDALAGAMSEVIAHPLFARERGRRGRSKVLQGYDQASILRQHEVLYARALPTLRTHSPRLPEPCIQVS